MWINNWRSKIANTCTSLHFQQYYTQSKVKLMQRKEDKVASKYIDYKQKQKYLNKSGICVPSNSELVAKGGNADHFRAPLNLPPVEVGFVFKYCTLCSL